GPGPAPGSTFCQSFAVPDSTSFWAHRRVWEGLASLPGVTNRLPRRVDVTPVASLSDAVGVARWRSRSEGHQPALSGCPPSLSGDFATSAAQRGELAPPPLTRPRRRAASAGAGQVARGGLGGQQVAERRRRCLRLAGRNLKVPRCPGPVATPGKWK